jgi:hypothetical protein
LCGTSPALDEHRNRLKERIKMKIDFRHDVDNLLREAKKQNKPVLLDFSAAPM